MKKVLKSAVLWLVVISMLASVNTVLVFATEAETQQAETESTLAENIERIINNLSLFSRYEEISKETLYQTAFETVFEEDPVLYEKVLKTMLSSIDEHSAYYNEEEASQFLLDLNDEITGIGVNVLMSDGNIIVSQPIPGSPADKAGIKAGDIIIGADDFDLRGMEFDAALDKIRGREGTEVKIKVIRSNMRDALIFTVKREKITQNPVEYELIETENKKIARIIIYSFTENVAEHFKEALDMAAEDGTTNIIIDLRDNGGGYFDQAIEIADMFLPKGAIITTEEHKFTLLNRVYTASGTSKKYDVVVLVNGMSASASEVLTAALVDNGAAKAVGQKTFGKGTVQTMNYTPEGGIMKYTSAYYLTPSGENINEIGITPTVVVENSFSPLDISEFTPFSLSKTYRIGDSGAEVKLAKEMLKELGVFVGEVNEVYDENLKIAVNIYQKADGLFPYGVLDITTQMNLYDTLRTAKVENDDQLQAAIDIF